MLFQARLRGKEAEVEKAAQEQAHRIETVQAELTLAQSRVRELQDEAETRCAQHRSALQQLESQVSLGRARRYTLCRAVSRLAATGATMPPLCARCIDYGAPSGAAFDV